MAGALALAMVPAQAAAESTPATDFQLGLSSHTPRSGTAASLYILYKRPGDPSAKPSALTRVVITLPSGSRYHGSAVPTCTASDQELMVLGAAACPAGSKVGRGTVTVVTGLGPPTDPVNFNATFLNQGGGLILMLSQPQTNLTMVVVHGKFTAPGTLAFDPIPSAPGGPPDFKSAVRKVNVRLDNVGSARHPFITTPPQCSRRRTWTSQLDYSTADGKRYRVRSTTPCTNRHRASHRPTPGGNPRGSTTFRGSCQLTGSVRFAPALTGAPAQGRVYASAVGTCTGTLTGPGGAAHSVSGQTVTAVAQSQGLESCGAGKGTGSGYVDFGVRRVHFTYNEVRAGAVLTLKADGASGGSAVAEGNVSPSDNPVGVLQACGSSGLKQAPIDIRLATTPAISG